MIAQQLLVLPYLSTNPVQLPFRTTHVFLVGTRCKINQGPGLPISAVPGKPRSLEERRNGAKRVIAATLDPAWLELNGARFDEILAKVVNNNLRCVDFSPSTCPFRRLNKVLDSNRPADMVG